MQIKGLGQQIAKGQLKFEVEQGGRFVMYQYCISALIVTMRHNTDIYFVRTGENRIVKGLPWTLLSLLLGWWGIPWGPIYTVGSLWTNLRGGTDVTADVLLHFDIGFVDLAASASAG